MSADRFMTSFTLNLSVARRDLHSAPNRCNSRNKTMELRPRKKKLVWKHVQPPSPSNVGQSTVRCSFLRSCALRCYLNHVACSPSVPLHVPQPRIARVSARGYAPSRSSTPSPGPRHPQRRHKETKVSGWLYLVHPLFHNESDCHYIVKICVFYLIRSGDTSSTTRAAKGLAGTEPATSCIRSERLDHSANKVLEIKR